jgi:3-oxoacyl-[acyl-carrier protein] reductase
VQTVAAEARMGMLEGRVAIVTAGGGPGMGRAFCKALAAEGAAVAVADIDGGRAEQVAREIKAAGGAAIAVPADVSAAAEVERMVARTVEAFGTVSILANHAGILPGGPLEDLTEEKWDKAMGVHLKGAFLCAQAALPHMRRNRWGRIVSTASRAGFRPMGPGRADYAAAKAGLVGFSRALAMEVGEDGITVNVIAPGVVAGTGMVSGLAVSAEDDQRSAEAEGQALPPRPVRPDEIAGALLYLVGPYSDRVTGTVVHVNGGSYFPA